jgi:colicin import membrane protein
LQENSNSEVQRFPSVKGKGLLGTTLIHIGLFMLLVLVTFSVPAPPDNGEGILVNFGTGETGLGDIEPSPPPGVKVDAPPPQPVQKKTSLPAAATTEKKSKAESLVTQDNEEAPVVKKADPAAEKKKREKIEADRKIKEQLDAERAIKEKEEIERKKAEAEKQREADIMNKTKNALANSKNSGTGSTSEGIAGGTGNQGDPRGSVDSKVRGEGGGTGTSGTGTGSNGTSFKLEGRNFQSLPNPRYDYQGEGRVVVEVSVDKSGKVVQAIPGIKGSTTLDEYLLKVAKEAAMKATFTAKSDAPAVQKGTITYNFILK